MVVTWTIFQAKSWNIRKRYRHCSKKYIRAELQRLKKMFKNHRKLQVCGYFAFAILNHLDRFEKKNVKIKYRWVLYICCIILMVLLGQHYQNYFRYVLVTNGGCVNAFSILTMQNRRRVWWPFELLRRVCHKCSIFYLNVS